MLLVVTSNKNMRRRFLNLANKRVQVAPKQEIIHLGGPSFIVDESNKTLYKVIQSMQKSKRMQVYRIEPVTHAELIDKFIS